MLNSKERYLHYDFIRIIACMLVLVNHTIAVFSQYGLIPLHAWLVSDFMFFISKMAVPLFVMLSGALLLKREESYRKLYVNRILKLAVIFIIWSIIYSAYYSKKLFLTFDDLLATFKSILINPASTHFWYLYMLLGLYLMLPFIRKMVQNFKEKDYLIFLTLWAIFACFLPFVSVMYPIKYSHYFEVPMFTGYIGYLVAGHYLDTFKLNKKILIWSIVLFVIGLLVSTVYTYHKSIVIGSTAKDLDYPLIFPVMISTLACFLLLKCLGLKLINRLEKYNVIKKVIVDVSNATLGIYLIHILIITVAPNIFKQFFDGYIYSLHKTIIWEMALFIICYIIITTAKRIPLVKHIV